MYTTETALDQYLQTLENETTRTNYEIALKEFVTNYKIFQHINKNSVEEYKETLNDKSPQTIAARLAAIRSFLDFCWTKGWIPFNPALSVKNDPVEKYAQAKNISFDDFKKFLSQIDSNTLTGIRDLLLIRLIFFYGDPIKILTMPFQQILSENFSKIKEAYEIALSKVTKLPRLYYGYLFFNLEELNNSKPLSLSTARKLIIKYTKKANFPHNYIDFEALKRLRAMQIYQQTNSVESVQKFCGHKSLKVTKAFLKTLNI